MKERPILFSASMVRAILEGRKTQTRRVVKPQPSDAHNWQGWIVESSCRKDEGKACWAIGNSPLLNKPHRVKPPFGKPGDRLWVRETWMADPSCDDDAWDDHHVSWREWDGCGCRTIDIPTQLCKVENVIHKASWDGIEMVGWKPSIHMPRWASRITLEVTGVRVERLQDISSADCIAEGCSGGHGSIPFYPYSATEKEHYHWLWDSINGAGSWDANPWVWVVEFKALKP